jgi:cytochrome d ubiquinol oxidase subunit I
MVVGYAGSLHSLGYAEGIVAIAAALEPVGGRVLVHCTLSDDSRRRMGLDRPNIEYYIGQGKVKEIAKTMLKVSLPIFCVLAVLQAAVFGANQATEVTQYQPQKLAAMEGVWSDQSCAPMYILGWVNTSEQTTTGIKIPCLLSILVGKSPDTVVQGLNSFPADEHPPVNLVFQVYHVMIDLGSLFVGIAALVAFMAWRRKLFTSKWTLRLIAINVLLVLLAIEAGWWTTEFGRQPWIVWQQLRTLDAASPNVSTTSVAISLIGFVIVYAVLLAMFVWLLNRKIQEGPGDAPAPEDLESLPNSFGEIFARRPRASSRVE